MKAIITRYSIDKHPDDSNDDFIFIHAFFRTDNYPEASMPVIFSFDNLVNFISAKDEATGNYLKRIRYNIQGRGPKHATMMDIMLEENYDLEPYIFQFIESNEAEYILQHLESPAKLSLTDSHSASECYNELSENRDMLHHKITFRNFQNELDKTIHDITVKYFPKIIELDKQYLIAYKDKLVDLTLSFSESVDKIIQGKFDSYWEDNTSEQL
jgi:hypothetical protein